MAQIEAAPSENWIPAGRKLLFTFSPNETVTNAYRYIVQVEENGTDISKIYLTPNPTDNAFFDLSEVISGRLEVDSLKYNATSTIHSFHNKMFTRSNDNMKRYRVATSSGVGSIGSNASHPTSILSRCTVILSPCTAVSVENLDLEQG